MAAARQAFQNESNEIETANGPEKSDRPVGAAVGKNADSEPAIVLVPPAHLRHRRGAGFYFFLLDK